MAGFLWVTVTNGLLAVHRGSVGFRRIHREAQESLSGWIHVGHGRTGWSVEELNLRGTVVMKDGIY